MARRASTLLDKVFDVGVVIKGVDGAIELIAGLLLWLSPGVVHAVLQDLGGEASESDSSVPFLATSLAHLDANLAAGGSVFLIVFLISHGVIKLALVYCLLRRYVRVYPWAIGVLVVFLAYQVYVLVTAPTISAAVFTALDVVIIVLVWREYRELRRTPVAATA